METGRAIYGQSNRRFLVASSSSSRVFRSVRRPNHLFAASSNWTMVPYWRRCYFHSLESGRPYFGLLLSSESYFWPQWYFPVMWTKKINWSFSAPLDINSPLGTHMNCQIVVEIIGALTFAAFKAGTRSRFLKIRPHIFASGSWCQRWFENVFAVHLQHSIILLTNACFSTRSSRTFFNSTLFFRRHIVLTKANSTRLPKMKRQQPRNHTSDTLM